MDFALLTDLNKTNTCVENISTWRDLFKNTVYWANIDEAYASNLFLLNLAEMQSLCDETEIDSFIYNIIDNDYNLSLPNTQTPSWIRDAIEMQLDYLKSVQS